MRTGWYGLIFILAGLLIGAGGWVAFQPRLAEPNSTVTKGAGPLADNLAGVLDKIDGILASHDGADPTTWEPLVLSALEDLRAAADAMTQAARNTPSDLEIRASAARDLEREIRHRLIRDGAVPSVLEELRARSTALGAISAADGQEPQIGDPVPSGDTTLAIVLLSIGFGLAFGAILLLLRGYKEIKNQRDMLKKGISERTRELDRTHNRLLAVLDNAPVEIYLKDRDGRYERINRQFERLFDVKNEDVVGLLPTDVHDPELGAITRAHDQKVLKTGETTIEEHEAVLEDGSHYLYTIKFPILDDSGTVDGLGAIVADMTELYRARGLLDQTERRLQAVLQYSPAFIKLKDRDGRVELISASYERALGFEPMETIGKMPDEIYDPELAADIRAQDLEVLNSGEVSTQEFRMMVRGEERFYRNVKFPIFNADNEIDGICAIYLDITDTRKTADDLRAAKETAELAARAKSDFLANMSHEIRTPLNAILGFSDVLRQEFFGPIDNERYRSYIEDIFRSGTHLMALLGDILDLSKVEAGRYEIEEVNVVVSDVIAECVQISAGSAMGKQLDVSEASDTTLGLRADSRALKQIILNLLSNAIKFTPSGGSIEVSWGRDADGAPLLAVSDTGIGIARDDIDKVIQPFTQGGQPMVSDQPGTGIGLSLTSELVKLHDAELAIESTPGVGTRVMITFPASRAIQTLP